ncbi:cAMP-dependent protein kinase type 2, partial [Candida tropicalis]
NNNNNNKDNENSTSKNNSSTSLGLSKKPSRHVNKDTTTKGKYTLNDFQILRTLGTGSFGRVHLTRSIHNGRFYAMKVLKKQRVVQMKQIEHTNDERRMLKLAQHPFIIRMWGTFQDCHNLFMIMDYIEGGELFSLLRKSQRFPTPVAKFYAAEVFLAIEYLHNLDIIYRDLKPENILLDKNGHIKLTDFGFAKEVQDVTYTLCGTPDYIAPEVVATKPYNKSVDWWSFGILIFEMLTGYTPFYDPTPMKTYENILNGTITYPDYLPPDILDLLQKLIVKDLTQRLGNLQGGSNDVKNHPWFKEVIWERLLSRDIETPYEPPITSGVGDTSQFDRYPEDKDLDYGISGVEDPYRDQFEDF